MTTFHPDGPHSPEQTIAAAEQVAHLLKFLNMATRSGQDGLGRPEDLYAVLGALRTAAERLPQLCGQLGTFLLNQDATGRLGDSSGGDPHERAGTAWADLQYAAERAGDVARALQAVQNAATGLYLKGDDDE